LAAVVNEVLCLAWQDNNIVLALSNIYTVNRVEDFREKQRKRPAKTSNELLERPLEMNTLRIYIYLALLMIIITIWEV
jgi:hypothetical protein